MSLPGRRPLVHLQFHPQKIRGDVGEKHEAQNTPCQQTDRKNQQRDKNRECQVAMRQGLVQKGGIIIVDKMMQPFAEKALKSNKNVMRLFFVVPDLHMRQVGRQDQF